MLSFYFWSGVMVLGLGALAAAQEKVGGRIMIGVFALGWVAFAVLVGVAAR